MPILKINFSSGFLKMVANHIKTKRAKPEETLVDEGQVCDKLYFLVYGQIKSFINIKKGDFPFTTMKTIKSNSIFD